MSVRTLVIALLAVLLAASAACADGGTASGTPTPAPLASPSPETGRSPAPSAESVTVRFEGADVRAEVAASSAERAQGLMDRESLDRDAGMLFLFPQRGRGAFWMKNTLIPLSIGFLRAEGGGSFTLVSILEMEPCREDPCPTYRPEAEYDAALEVNRGWFAERGVTVGDTAQVDGDLPTAPD